MLKTTSLLFLSPIYHLHSYNVRDNGHLNCFHLSTIYIVTTWGTTDIWIVFVVWWWWKPFVMKCLCDFHLKIEKYQFSYAMRHNDASPPPPTKMRHFQIFYKIHSFLNNVSNVLDSKEIACIFEEPLNSHIIVG